MMTTLGSANFHLHVDTIKRKERRKKGKKIFFLCGGLSFKFLTYKTELWTTQNKRTTYVQISIVGKYF